MIPVTFLFEDTTDTGKYKAWTGGYDRSGRISSISFIVDGKLGPYTDPLDVYFAGGFFMGGGLGNQHVLGHYEQVFHMNEWVRFDQPGRYRFYATSNRVSSTADNVSHSVELASQIVEIEITKPTDTQLNTAYESAVTDYKPQDWKSRDKTYEALSRLRFLDSARSRLRLREILGEGEGGAHAAMFGLIGSREIDATIELLEKGITSQHVPVTPNYMNALAKLRRTEDSRKKIAENPGGNSFLLFPSLEDQYGDRNDWRKLAADFEKKQDRARAVSASSLLEVISSEVRNAGERSRGFIVMSAPNRDHLDHEAVLAKIKVPLAKVYLELNKDEQVRLLEDFWDLIRCPEFEETLRKMVNPPFDKPNSAPYSGLQSWAVLRYTELNPEAGLNLILEDIRRKRPIYSLPVLCSLPSEKVEPELGRLAEYFNTEGTDLEKIAGMISQYGDDTIHDSVLKRYLEREGQWTCAIQKHCLHYFIKTRREEGLDLAFRAATLREKTGCYRSIVPDVLEPFYSPDVEKRLVPVFLAERDPDVIVNISRVLKKRGSESVIDSLLDQVERLDPVAADGDYSYDTKAGARRELVTVIFRTAGKMDFDKESERWKLTAQQKSRFKSLLQRDEDLKQFEEAFEK